ncbi:MAG: UDP-N-acetylmuramate--L-alanine ligase [Syntrophobacterales bacterium]|nr:UDP-N-acetylmuramate--L-alanine ligase [Syntrophobacterales bacterium]
MKRRYPPYQHVHFVGIGGSGMSGIAEVLLNLGYHVSGSDLKESETTKRLASLGARIFIGHSKENIHGADVVVYSSAVRADNPELEEARRLKHVPIIPRAEMLAEIMRMKHSILVAGAHGKTTTTSMIGTMLVSGGFDPTVVIGGRLRAWGSNAKMGTGDFFVAEADESDGSFLMLSPTMAVVTNIDLEHLDYYRDIEHIAETFINFLNKIPFYGSAIVCIDNVITDWPYNGSNPSIQEANFMRSLIIPSLKRKVITYGFSQDADIRAEEIIRDGFQTRYKLIVDGKPVETVNLNVPGIHNVLNSLAAVGVGIELGMSPKEISEGLSQFTGVDRRFHIKGEAKDILILDDYGHHPREIQAVLQTMKECFPERRRIVVFQPHRYTRTRALIDDFTKCFEACHVLVMTDIYAAGELPIPGITGDILAKRVMERRAGKGEVIYTPELEKALQKLKEIVLPGDVVLTLGAGNVWTVGEKLLDHLSNEKL